MDEHVAGCFFVGRMGLFYVYCDFPVICLEDIGSLKKGDRVWVNAVVSSQSGKIVYLIAGSYYFHHYFVFVEKPQKSS